MTEGARHAGPQFIAEVSSNHNRDLDRALRFVDAAADAGCDAVKFQLFRVDELFAPEVLERSATHRARADWELPLDFLPVLAERCREVGIAFACTPFYLDAVEELLPFVDFYKIASYELLWDALLARCAATGKPIVLSTGMADLDEVRHAYEVISTAGASDITLLHCVSNYPARAEDCNLSVIQTLRNEFSCAVGWSDHSVDSAVIMRAVHRWGAEMVEFHFDLDEEGEEYGGGHCWLPSAIKPAIKEIRRGIAADGTGDKTPAGSEAHEREWRADPSDGLRPLRSVRKSRE